jgi:lipoprotein-anchoring transpeptidase ErfK/SrfK
MLSRRHLLGSGLAALGLAASGRAALAHDDAAAAAALPPDWAPSLVQIPPGFAPYEIHVDPDTFSLFWTLPDDQAIRYRVGIARAGLYEPGSYFVGAKKEWPSWTPTPAMVEREPELYGPWAETGMPGGPDNPLGARALYLFAEGRGDTFMRIHGTNAPNTIGTAVSNGCVRLVNEHVVDLYDRVQVDAPVVLYTSMSGLNS